MNFVGFAHACGCLQRNSDRRRTESAHFLISARALVYLCSKHARPIFWVPVRVPSFDLHSTGASDGNPEISTMFFDVSQNHAALLSGFRRHGPGACWSGLVPDQLLQRRSGSGVSV